MTDAPDGPAGVQPERGGARRPGRAGDSGSPVGSTLSIVLAVLAVVAGFLILRAITDDDDDDAGGITPPGSTPTDDSTAPTGSVGATVTTARRRPPPLPGRCAPVPPSSVANASGIGGSAAGMTTALQGAGYTLGEAGNNTTGTNLDASVVYFVAGDPAAQAVAQSVATDMGGIAVMEMPAEPTIDVGLGTSTVLVMVGTDTAGKTLADLNPTTVTAPPAAGVTTTTAAGG